MSKLHERRRLRRPVLHRLLRIEKRRPILIRGVLQKRKRGVIPMYNLRSGHLTIVHQNHAHANVGAYARCHRIVIYNLSRIEVRVQQQKRYMAILCFCFPCGWCKYRNFVSNNQQKEYFLDKLKIISVIDVSCQKWVIYLRQFLIPVKLDRNRKCSQTRRSSLAIPVFAVTLRVLPAYPTFIRQACVCWKTQAYGMQAGVRDAFGVPLAY